MRIFSLRSILSGLLCLLILTGCGLLGKNSPMDAADAFFVLLCQGRTRQAYESAAFMLQAEISLQTFEAMVLDLGLEDCTAGGWSIRSVSTKEAILDGGMVRKNGAKFPVKATLIRQSGRWKLAALRTPGPGGEGRLIDRFTHIGHGAEIRDGVTRPVPDDREVRALLAGTMKAFNEGLHKKNFTKFYDTISGSWQAQTSKADVERAFQSLLDGGTTIDAIEHVSPVFDLPPRLNADGLLLVKGRYPVNPNPVIFDLKYACELPRWRLIGITITVK